MTQLKSDRVRRGKAEGGETRAEIAVRRRSEIIDAFIDCVRRLGLQGSTVEQVAKAAGVSRTLIFHYFSDMDSLLQASVERIVSNSIRDLTHLREELTADERKERLIDFVVAGDHFKVLSEVVIVSEVVSLAIRDTKIRDLVCVGYKASIATKAAELAACFPEADPAAREAVAYSLMCLSETHWHFSAIGLGESHEQDVRMACRGLFAILEKRGD